MQSFMKSEERAEFLRKRAQELRDAAETFTSAEFAKIILRVAWRYEDFADDIERNARCPSV